MAGGKITRIVGGTNSIECDRWTVYTDEFNAYAGGRSSFTADGGTNFGKPEEPPPTGKYFVKGWWTNHRNEPIKRAVYGQTLKFHIQMNKEFVQVGGIVEFGLYDSDMQSFGNDVIKADDPIKLMDKRTKSCYSSEKINEDYKVIIEFTTSDEMLQLAGKLDQDGIYELYFRCRYWNKGEIEEVELLELFQDYLQLGTIVIDRYKMPGLNPEGTGIAEDLAYGTGFPYKTKNIYTQEVINKYKEEYIENGFVENWHIDFANGMLGAKEIEEVVIVGKKKQKSEIIIPPPTAVIDNLRVEKTIIPIEEIIKQQEEQRAKTKKQFIRKRK